MKGLFIDCGGHIGESVEYFKSSEIYKKYRWDIHTFEPHPDLIEQMVCKDDGDVTIHQKAVWVNDEELDFFPSTKKGSYLNKNGVLWGSGTLMRTKNSGCLDFDNPIKVQAVNLSQFIFENSKDFEFTILKMDVEGAEYEILKHLIKTGAIKCISYLLVEFHHNKMSGKILDHFCLLLRLKLLGIPMIVEKLDHKSGDWFSEIK